MSNERGEKPLQVYLDSSDFSVLSDERTDAARYREVERRLVAWQQSGEIQLRYSYAHVIEAAPVAPSDLEMARRRLVCIQRLCGKNCFQDPFSVFELELRSAVGEIEAFDALDLHRSDGSWMPEFADAVGELPSLSALILEDLDAKNMNRSARRKAEQIYFDSKGAFRRAALPRISAFAEAAVRQAAELYPLNSSALSEFGRYLRQGNGSKENLIRGIKASLSDLECFADWYKKQWEHTAPLSRKLRDSGEILRHCLQGCADTIGSLCDSHMADGGSSKFIEDQFREVFARTVESVPNNLARKMASAFSIPSADVLVCSWDRTKALMTTTLIACQLGKLTALVPKTRRPPKVSDLGDILHATYLPYVDIFRADGFVANAVSSAKLPGGAIVVPKLMALPETIERLLAKKARPGNLGESQVVTGQR